MGKKPVKTDRKALLVQSAIECFIKKGVAQATMREIADKAGVDQPLLHYYFKSTDELYVEVVRKVLESLRQTSVPASVESPDAATVLREYISGTFAWARDNPGLFSIWMYFYYLSSFKPEFLKLNQEIRHVGRSRIAMMIHQGIEQGKFNIPKGKSVQDLALMIQGYLTGACILVASEKGDWAHAMRVTIEGSLAWLHAAEQKSAGASRQPGGGSPG